MSNRQPPHVPSWPSRRYLDYQKRQMKSASRLSPHHQGGSNQKGLERDPEHLARTNEKLKPGTEHVAEYKINPNQHNHSVEQDEVQNAPKSIQNKALGPVGDEDWTMRNASPERVSSSPSGQGASQSLGKRKQADDSQDPVRQVPNQGRGWTSPEPENLKPDSPRWNPIPPSPDAGRPSSLPITVGSSSIQGTVPSTPPSTAPSSCPPDRSTSQMLREPYSRPITQDQLTAEVKSIHTGLVMVETKCIHVVQAQMYALENAADGEPPALKSDDWQALIALARTLLHEHHDFFLASQHPSAGPALRRLAARYSMPARMWKHGIHSFLELFRYRLPASFEYMLSFIYLAYQIMALLYETVPSFRETWIECLGDLARYRMAVEEESLQDREIWAGVARGWYEMANTLIPNVGRLDHHLAILSRHNPLLQLHYYCRSLTAVQPFIGTRDSILTLIDPVLNGTSTTVLAAEDKAFIKSVAIMLKGVQLESLPETKAEYMHLLETRLKEGRDWTARGIHTAISLIAGIFEYGFEASGLRRAYDIRIQRRLEGRMAALKGTGPAATVTSMEHGVKNLKIHPTEESLRPAFVAAVDMNRDVFQLVAKHKSRADVLAFVHIQLAFLLSLSTALESRGDVLNLYDGITYYRSAPWQELAELLNHAALTLPESERNRASYSHLDFLHTIPKESILPDDVFLRGHIITREVYPDSIDEKLLQVPEEDRLKERPKTHRDRLDRVLYLGIQLARKVPQYLQYDKETGLWSTPQRMGSSQDAFQKVDSKLSMASGFHAHSQISTR